MELKWWIVIDTCWKRKLGSRLSHEIDATLWPSSEKKEINDSFNGPSVSAVIGWNRRPVCAKRSYLAVIRPAACSAAAPPERAVAFTWESASVCATVTSQVKGSPRCHGISVKPSGRLPSWLANESSHRNTHQNRLSSGSLPATSLKLTSSSLVKILFTLSDHAYVYQSHLQLNVQYFI